MTIDARNSVRKENSTFRTIKRPHGIVSKPAEGKSQRYDKRLFFCHIKGSEIRADEGLCRALGNISSVGAEYIQPRETAKGLNVFNPYKGGDDSTISWQNKDVFPPLEEGTFEVQEKQRSTPRVGAENVEILRNCLAFRVKFYYNKGLYFVVGPWLMQGVAKLRKVAEVNRTGFNYLKLTHIANSKGTFVVK